MNLFQEMEVNYKDFIESANDFIDSCREYINNNEDEKIFLQFGEITERKRWKDKIKAKIEEIDRKIEFEQNEKVIIYLHKQKRVLQSLLEKE